MNLKKGTYLDGAPILTSRNHNDLGNPHAQYGTGLSKIRCTTTGYACFYSRTFNGFNNKLIYIKAKIIPSNISKDTFDCEVHLINNGGNIKRVTIKGNENLYLAYAVNGNNITISLYLNLSESNDYHVIIPEYDFYTSINADEYNSFVKPNPLLGETGFKNAATSVVESLPENLTIINANM